MNTSFMQEMRDLKKAKVLLENPGFAIKAINHIGKPIEFAIEKIDSETLNRATTTALRKSLDMAIATMGK